MEDISLTIKLPSKKVVVETGKLKKPLKKRELLSMMMAELKKENIPDILDLGVYPLNLKLWVVRDKEV